MIINENHSQTKEDNRRNEMSNNAGETFLPALVASPSIDLNFLEDTPKASKRGSPGVLYIWGGGGGVGGWDDASMYGCGFRKHSNAMQNVAPPLPTTLIDWRQQQQQDVVEDEDILLDNVVVVSKNNEDIKNGVLQQQQQQQQQHHYHVHHHHHHHQEEEERPPPVVVGGVENVSNSIITATTNGKSRDERLISSPPGMAIVECAEVVFDDEAAMVGGGGVESETSFRLTLPIGRPSDYEDITAAHRGGGGVGFVVAAGKYVPPHKRGDTPNATTTSTATTTPPSVVTIPNSNSNVLLGNGVEEVVVAITTCPQPKIFFENQEKTANHFLLNNNNNNTIESPEERNTTASIIGTAPARKWGAAVDTYVGAITDDHPDFIPLPNMDGLLDNCGGKTTIMWRNIPCKYTVALLRSIVDPHFKGLYDFFYLPIDFRNKRNIGYAFLNFLHPQFAEAFRVRFDGIKLNHFKSNKVSEVCWAHIQGLDANIEHFRNSALMTVPNPDHKPILFKNGIAQPFPGPTKERELLSILQSGATSSLLAQRCQSANSSLLPRPNKWPTREQHYSAASSTTTAGAAGGDGNETINRLFLSALTNDLGTMSCCSDLSRRFVPLHFTPRKALVHCRDRIELL